MKTYVGRAGPAVLINIWVGMFISGIAVGLRAFSATHKDGKWRWDFIWIALAYAWSLGCAVIGTIAVTKGLGLHFYDLPFAQLSNTIHWIWIFILTGLPGTVLSKWSVIALLLEVQSSQARKRRMMLYFIGFMLASSAIIQIFLSLTQCDPMERLWNVLYHGTCERGRVARGFSWFQGALNAFVDLVLAIWPISVVWNLQTTLRIKISFCVLMSTVGIIPCIAAIIKTLKLWHSIEGSDPLYDTAQLMIWGTVENWVVIVFASIPPLRPLWLRIKHRLRPTTSPPIQYSEQSSSNRPRKLLPWTSDTADPKSLQSDMVSVVDSEPAIHFHPRTSISHA